MLWHGTPLYSSSLTCELLLRRICVERPRPAFVLRVLLLDLRVRLRPEVVGHQVVGEGAHAALGQAGQLLVAVGGERKWKADPLLQLEKNGTVLVNEFDDVQSAIKALLEKITSHVEDPGTTA